MFVMVQLEVAERLAGTPGSRAYGIPSVKVAWWADAHVVGKVPPTVFIPPPRVDSGLVEIVRRPPAGDVDERQAVFALAEAGFNQRRKMLPRSLAHSVDAEAFVLSGLRTTPQPVRLVLADCICLAAVSPTPHPCPAPPPHCHPHVS